MSSLKQIPLQFNPNISFDFSGGNLSSDSGLILQFRIIKKGTKYAIAEGRINYATPSFGW